MRRAVWLLWIIGLYGSIAAADAQTDTQFDGTYAFVSATKVNETYRTADNRPRQCPEIRKVGPLVIVNGQARYSTSRSDQILNEGTVGLQGELAMRYVEPINLGTKPGFEIITHGRIDDNGMVRARRMANYCSFDLIWQKAPK